MSTAAENSKNYSSDSPSFKEGFSTIPKWLLWAVALIVGFKVLIAWEMSLEKEWETEYFFERTLSTTPIYTGNRKSWLNICLLRMGTYTQFSKENYRFTVKVHHSILEPQIFSLTSKEEDSCTRVEILWDWPEGSVAKVEGYRARGFDIKIERTRDNQLEQATLGLVPGWLYN